jgi:uncharacterized protein (DUF302 family)
MERSGPYGFGRTTEKPYEEVVASVRKALEEEGFGILSEIDVHAKLKEKLNVDFRPYIILGACNPKLAHRALSAEIDLGLLLPCNVIVYSDDERRTVIMAMDPEKMMSAIENPAMEEIAGEVRDLLKRAIEKV